MMMNRYLLILLFSLLTASTQIPAPPQSTPILISGGTIHTISGGAVTGFDILIEGGIISEIGTGIEIPPGTEIIKAEGKHIYPGLISAGSSLGLQEINAVRSTRDYAEVGSVNPNVRANVSYHPDSELIPVARSNGILLANVIPKSGRVPGTSSLMMLDGWTWEDCTMKHPVGVHLNWPSMDIQSGWWNKNSPKEQKKNRSKALIEIEELFRDARAYASLNPTSPGFKHDRKLEAFKPVLNGEIPLFVQANTVRQIEFAVNWADENNLKIVIFGGKDAWRTTDLLAEKNVPVIYESVLSTPLRRFEDYDQAYKTPRILLNAGVKFCISTSSSSFQTPHLRDLPYHAAMASSFGLPRDEALRSITLTVAEILGIDDKVGSIEMGKDATLFIADGDILEIPTLVESAFIQGRKIDLSDRHKMLYQKYTEKYRQKGILE